MRKLALAGAVLLMLAAGMADAQIIDPRTNPSILNPYPTQDQGIPGAATDNTYAGQISRGNSTLGQQQAAAASAQRSGAPSQAGQNGLSANPLAGATAASAGVSEAVQATQNPQSLIQGFIFTTDGLRLPVFGTELFTGSFAGSRPADRPDYIIQSGDQVVVNLFGAVNSGSSQIVDAQGNVFIVGVGPVHVLGARAGDLQSVVSSRVREVFTGAVGVYATVGQAGSVGVFVSGDVNRPGRYLGSSHDSVLFFLSQAGGIDAARGSFRNVTVRRGGQVVASYDLYDFLLNGQTQPIRFQDGDVVFVAPRGAMVGVTGNVRNAFAFEAPKGTGTMTGADLLPMTRPEPTVTGAGLRGFRNGTPRAAYFPMSDLSRVVLQDGDHVDFRSDAFVDTVTVSVQGEIKGPSIYVLPRGGTLSQLMARIPLDGTDVEPRFVHVQRLEVALEQKRALNDALFNLQKQVLTSSPQTTAAAALATSQATLINQFVDRASRAVPDGNIAVYSNGHFQDLRLQDGDVVILPSRTDVVIVAGEVLNPGGLAHAPGLTIKGYIARAGGFAAHANEGRFVLRHRDGSGEVADGNTRPQPGDEIVVLPKVGSSFLQWATDISQLLFQLALTTATVIQL